MCTIDTGNIQGNFVSQKFLVEQLGVPPADFRPLTERERRGIIGTAQQGFIPQGAVYLTWYHSRSSRVYHNMRFLILPNVHADLVLGAHSIHKYNLLTVPNSMPDYSKIQEGILLQLLIN